LTPKFTWRHPSEWGEKLNAHRLSIQVTCILSNGSVYKLAPYFLMPDPFQYQPVFEWRLNIPEDVRERVPFKKEYPIQVIVELLGEKNREFDVMVIYDEA